MLVHVLWGSPHPRTLNTSQSSVCVLLHEGKSVLMFDNAAIILFLIGLAAETMNLTDLAAEIMSHLLCLYITSIYKVVVGENKAGDEN